MIEVPSGVQFGQRLRRLVLSAAVVAASLGAAWVQVRARHSLGDEQAIDGTPLAVRPPAKWSAVRDQPGLFVLQVRRESAGRQRWEMDRKIQISFQPGVAFEPLAGWLAANIPGGFTPEPARIGPLAAVQIRQRLERRWGRQVLVGESVLRVTCLPGGGVISVAYMPMTDLTLADLTLLDRVCDSIRLTDPKLTPTAGQAQARAGVQFPESADWRFGLPELDDVAGLFVGGTAEGFPAWSVGVFRTWLAAGRTPRDVLLDFAGTMWLLAENELEIRAGRRADGADAASVTHPQPARNRHPVAAAHVVARSPSEVVLLLVYTNATHLTAAAAAAQQIADRIVIGPVPGVPSPAEAAARGAELAELLTRKGAAPWWSRQRIALRYRGVTPRDAELLLVERGAVQRDPARGYEGSTRRRVRNQNFEDAAVWTIDGRGVSYTLRSERYYGDGVLVGMRERRPSGADIVHREVVVNDVPRRPTTFQPGAAFVCPPLEPVAEAWVARQPGGAWLIEAGGSLGPGSHTRLLRPLSPTADGQARVLVLVDYWPLGVEIAFDQDGEAIYELQQGRRYERIR